ncbi:MAG: nucleotidyltransferase domain-containing protein [Gallionellaceae bacterium]|nr:nucleotidyltransferase domain-containing protein [Gallionellaceae bacterium]
MPFDVKPEHLAIVKSILNTYLPDREIFAFGSRVTGKAKPTSDLDLCVIGESLPFEIAANLKLAFSNSDIPYAVDLVEWANCSESFRELIRKHQLRIF